MGSMVVNTNVRALNTYRSLKIVGLKQEKASNRLSSGCRINTASDDAAGLAISEKMRAQIRGINQASRNTNDAIALIQTTESGLAEIQNMMQRMRELTIQALNDTNTQYDRNMIKEEYAQLSQEIHEIHYNRTEYNTKKLLSGNSYGQMPNSELIFQVGANSNQTITADMSRVDMQQTNGIFCASLYVGVSNNFDTHESMNETLQRLDNSLEFVSEARAYLGAIQNRLEYTMSSLDVASENLQSSESRIRDADMAHEMMDLTKSNVLQQAAVAMLTQANQAPNHILQLLR